MGDSVPLNRWDPTWEFLPESGKAAAYHIVNEILTIYYVDILL